MKRLGLVLVGLVACDAGPLIVPPTAEVDDLPNGHLEEKLHDDGLTYDAIVDYIEENEDFDLEVDRDLIEASWPMAGTGTALLNRFGTPILGAENAYFHTALDVLRDDPQGSDVVHAPFAGLALPFDWWGRPGYTQVHYTSVVVIWDPDSHAIAFLNHVVPNTKLRDARRNFVAVEQGESVGTLAADLLHVPEADRERLRHTHFALLDGGARVALDPLDYMDYRDTSIPEIADFYVLDNEGERAANLTTGAIDVVVESFDRDDDSERNFEIAALAFEIRDQDGVILRSADHCDFDSFYESFADTNTEPITAFIDFGSAAHQIARSGWPGRDLDDRQRTFRYALTRLVAEGQGCRPAADDTSLVVGDDVSELQVRVVVWDQSGHRHETERVIRR